MKKSLFLIVCCTLNALLLTGQNRTVIICGNLIDGISETARANTVILVEGERIVRVGTRDLIAPGDSIVDLSGYTVMPGLIDMHVHPNLNVSDYQISHLKGSSAHKALVGLKAVQDLLAAGWTTLRVAGDGDVGYANMDIRDAINNGLFKGPRIYGAGHYLSISGGGGDINFLSHEQELIPDGLIVDGPEEMRKAVRREIKYGSDWIKVLVTGAFMSAGDNPNNVHMSSEELKMAVEEAARRDVPVMAHAHAAEGIKMAVKAGARTIEHGSFIDEEAMNLMIQHGTWLIPTLSVSTYYEGTEDAYLQKAKEIRKQRKESMYRNYQLARRKGVKFGLGSDFVGWPAPYSGNEFAEYLKLGFTPMQAIITATAVNAQILKKETEIGTLEAGKYADIIATKGNPLDDISEMTRVKFVMKGGEIIKNEGL
ncbi:amidohydrolase family protein [Robiginitalea sp. SC105]|uniref:metal-dependent hydrolase family protein n=1 Tax=Robiginitalea sp. SC105 TaxID=2762332 RepID=UPI0016397A6C|nr:amidohydrolase family protein [Robiginitalea sp. SC105]MBC2839719.1 amidohydrolase family protein [Robiginitalea sp. SC105]